MQKYFFVLVSLMFVQVAVSYEADPQAEQAKAAVSAHSNEVRMCYRDNAKKIKGAEGKIVVDFEVNDQGVLTKSEINEKKTTLKNEVLTKCLVEKIKTWMFPAAPKGKVTAFSYPFAFKNN